MVLSDIEPVPALGRVTATVGCVFCRWRARLTGDGPSDVVTSLRSILIAHTRERHCLAELRLALRHLPADVAGDAATVIEQAARLRGGELS